VYSSTTASNFLRGTRCPICNESRGERKIRNWLDENEVDYTTQDRFDDCKKERPLPFDFKVLDVSGELYGLVEFDGIQHFESRSAYGGEGGFKETQLRDQIKNDYCIKNKIPLLRIKYSAIDMVDEILEKFLNNPFILKDTILSDYMTNNDCHYVLLTQISVQ
jgi:hypothetical protein